MKAYLSLPALSAEASSTKSVFAGSQLPSNQPSAAAFLPALLHLAGGGWFVKGFFLLRYSAADIMQSLGTVNINSKVWCGRGWTETPVLSESQNHVDFFSLGFLKLPGRGGGDTQRCLQLQCGCVEIWVLRCLKFM